MNFYGDFCIFNVPCFFLVIPSKGDWIYLFSNKVMLSVQCSAQFFVDIKVLLGVDLDREECTFFNIANNFTYSEISVIVKCIGSVLRGVKWIVTDDSNL